MASDIVPKEALVDNSSGNRKAGGDSQLDNSDVAEELVLGEMDAGPLTWRRDEEVEAADFANHSLSLVSSKPRETMVLVLRPTL